MKKRFEEFKLALRQATGDKAILSPEGKVTILANEFSPAQTYRSLQAAIDHYAYLFRLD